jgi:hypothetical protein
MERCYRNAKESERRPVGPLPELSVETAPTDGDFADQLVITDLENSSKLNISL